MTAAGWRQADPAGREDAQKMRAGEDQHVAVGRADPLDDAIGAGADRGRILAARTTVAEQVPVGAVFMNVVRLGAFVLAIIPLDRIGQNLGLAAEAGQLAGAAGTLQRAGKHLDEAEALEAAGELAR